MARNDRTTIGAITTRHGDRIEVFRGNREWLPGAEGSLTSKGGGPICISVKAGDRLLLVAVTTAEAAQLAANLITVASD